MIKVSVIVPVYNVEKYLEKCLNSLVNQTLKDIEIIVVNDGTRDNSQIIIDKFKENFPSLIKSYIKENGGLSDARNYGMKYATGEYIAFVDSDDYIGLNMFEEMYSKAKSNDFDIVMCDLNYVYDNKVKFCSCNVKNDLLNKKQIKEKMVNIYPTAWNKIYKKTILVGFEFKKSIWYEDVEFMFRILPYINSIGVVNKPFYQYVQREGAISKTFNDKVFDYISNWNGLLEYYKENKIFNEYYEEFEYSYVRYLYATMIKSLAKSNNKEKYMYGVNLSIKNVNENFPYYKKNRYLKKFNLKNIYLKYFNPFLSKIIWIFK